MYIDFDEITAEARLWVYASNRALTTDEQKFIYEYLVTFVQSWDTHGAPILGSFKIVNDRFIILAADEKLNLPSGCSIDKSVSAIKEIERKLNVTLFDRATVYYFDNQNTLVSLGLSDLKAAVNLDKITSNTLVINQLVERKSDFLSQWITPAQNTWLKRYFPQ